MFKVALNLAAMPALVLAAVPAQSAVTLESAALATATAGNPFQSTGADRLAWYEKRTGSGPQLLGLAALSGFSALRATAPLATVSILPEPMSWAMTFVGMAIVGWVVRSRQKRGSQTVSFV